MKWIICIGDVLIAALLAIYFSVLFLFIFILRLFPRSVPAERVSLILTSGTSSANAKRNIDQWYSACLLDGYFKSIFFVYFIGDVYRHQRVNNQITIIDFRSNVATSFKNWNLVLSSTVFQVGHFIFFLFKMVRQERITHLEANDPYLEGLCLMMVSLLTGVPFFIRFNCDYQFYYREFKRLALSAMRFRWVERAMSFVVLRRARGVMALYGHYRKSAIQEGARSAASIASPPLLDVSYWQSDSVALPKTSPFALQSHPVLIYLGRLSWDKYCLDLVDVLVDVKKEIPNVRLVILGDGEIRNQFEQKARDQGVFESIFFPGFLPPEEIRAWAKVAKAMLATHGGFSLIEMGALGVPIVAYAHDWHQEIIQHKETGLIAGFRNVHEMATLAVELIRNADESKKLASNLKHLVHTEYHPTVAKRIMREFIESRRDA